MYPRESEDVSHKDGVFQINDKIFIAHLLYVEEKTCMCQLK